MTQFAHLKSSRLFAFLLLLNFASPVAQGGSLGPWMKAETCLMMLRMHPSDEAMRRNPLDSLRSLQEHLRGYGKVGADEVLPDRKGYSLQSDSVTRSVVPRARVLKALNRLSELELNTTKYDPDLFFIANEVRGWEALQALMERIEAYKTSVAPDIHKKIRQRLPFFWSHGLEDAFIFLLNGSILSSGAFELSSPTYKVAVGITFTFYLGLRIAQWAQFPDYRLAKHIRLIRKALDARQESESNFPISMYGDGLSLGTDFHLEIARTTGEELEPDSEIVLEELRPFFASGLDVMIGDFGRFLRNHGNLVNWAVNLANRYPEGPYRKVFTDQIFYMDPDTKEPVFLFYYRAFKGEPLNPKKPKENEKKDSPTDFYPENGLKPQPISK
ncbi:MAG: hypothetical protein IPL83_03495 [Bdellovibrionales bacterium]|nr:hypothetical protein [Bdellovibrionales bacterium]